jgi:outer membrane PBP1 activator LpoA protein
LNATAYVPESNNLSAPITELLNITRSEQRHRRLQANLGLPVEFEPRRRQDVDMIFLQADPGPGRLLAPQLRFHNAGDIPTYATSDIHDTARLEPESDLNGIQFPDLPLLLTPDTTSAALVDELQTFWPQRARQWIRYYSFGFDAYQLAQRIYQFPAGSWQLEGATGLLESDIDRRIHRRLPFAQFNGGRAQALPALPPPVAPAPNDGTVPEIIFGSR